MMRSDFHKGPRFGGWALGMALFFGLMIDAGLDPAQAAPAGQYTYAKLPDGEYRMSQDLNDPEVPARAAEVVKFISDLGYRPRSYGAPWTWRWRRNKSKPDTFQFIAGQFRAAPVSAQGMAVGLVISIHQGIEDPGYEVTPTHAGSMAMVDGSAFPGQQGLLAPYPKKFVPLPGKSGIWLGVALATAPRATLTCGAVTVQTNADPLVTRPPEEQRTKIEAYHSFMIDHLTGVHAKLCTSGLCRCVPASLTVELLDGNPAFHKKPDGSKHYDFTDPKAIRFFLNREDWIKGAHIKALVARETRKGAVADGVSLLILRSEVPSAGTSVFKLPGGEPDGSLYRIADGAPLGKGNSEVKVSVFEEEDAGRKRHWALALYLPPKSFGQGTVERRIKVEMTFTSLSRTESKGSGEIRLIRPPVVLVHGTFDNPDYCWNTKDIKEAVKTMRARLESEGFRVFMTDWRETNGEKDPSSFIHNRRAVWQNRGGIKEALESVRKEGFAVTQADVVAHSQGGILVRMYARGSWGLDTLKDDDYHFTSPRDCAETCEYHRPDNFAAGDIHRFITISTTHYGSDICRLFEAYRQFVDSRQYIGDAVLDYWNGLRTEAVLLLHPQRQIDVYAPSLSALTPGSLPFLPWALDQAVVKVNAGYISMINDAIWKKLDVFKDYAFTQGFRDQIPGSDGLLRIMKTPIPAHAIACTADDEAMRTLNNGYYQQRLDLMWILSSETLLGAAFRKLGQDEDAADLVRRRALEWQMVLKIYDLYKLTSLGDVKAGAQMNAMAERLFETIRANAARLRSAAFGNSENDCTVRKESSFGGLATKYTTVIPNVLHGPAPQYLPVQLRVVQLLKDSGTLFAPEGFPAAGVLPPPLPYKEPRVARSAGSPSPPADPAGFRRQSEGSKTSSAEPRTAAPRKAEPDDRLASNTQQTNFAALAPDGTLRLSLVGCQMRLQGNQIVVGSAEAPAPGAPNLLKSGAVLQSVFDLADGRDQAAKGLSLEELARILNTESPGASIVLRFVLPGGEPVDIPHPGRLGSGGGRK